MKAQELRLGNIISRMHDINEPVIEIVDMFTIDWINRNPNNETYKPIPLTEEWLLKFGFEKKGKRISKGWFYLWDENGIVVFALAEMQDYTGCYLKIKYVHQLQNLYYALTGEELCIK